MICAESEIMAKFQGPVQFDQPYRCENSIKPTFTYEVGLMSFSWFMVHQIESCACLWLE